MNAAVARYRSVQVTTSSREQVLLMLWDGVFRFLDEARAAHKRGDRSVFAERLQRAHAILDEFAVTLDSKHAPELCDRLRALYLFCMGRLAEATFAFDLVAVDDVARVLDPVYQAFREILRK